MKLTEGQLRFLIQQTLREYVVPMGYNYKKWLKKKKKENITNKSYAKDTKGDKWKVVDKKGNPLAKNLSYEKATKMLQAIELSKRGISESKKKSRKDLGKLLFTEYGYAIFQPFLAPLFYSTFGYIPPVNIPSHHRGELTPSIERKIEDLKTGTVPTILEPYKLKIEPIYLPAKDHEVEFVTKSNFNNVKLESFSVEDIRNLVKEILSKF